MITEMYDQDVNDKQIEIYNTLSGVICQSFIY